jgi:hypothetical protein
MQDSSSNPVARSPPSNLSTTMLSVPEGCLSSDSETQIRGKIRKIKNQNSMVLYYKKL